MSSRDHDPPSNPDTPPDGLQHTQSALSQITADPQQKRWAGVKELFASALALDPAQRKSFLETECANDHALLGEVESLLAAHGEAGEFLEQPVASVTSLAAMEPHPFESEHSLAGTRVGAYRLEKEIGCGGMGAVYLATRADNEYFKEVAIKLIPRGKASEFTIGRFRNKRQILAAIEHPYVARLLDGGTTDSGLPYFVMEYVDGVPLTDYCVAQSLAVDERLRLFVKVCSAVYYAHCRNVIHRDLKPSNILVQPDGTPKLLDFGIAKLLDSAIPGTSNDATAVGLRVLTPAYASPEQVRGDPVTVRTDIYSLGVILYELLCGERPHTGIAQRNLPSDRATDSHLSANLRAIVLDAIRPDPEERYQSVEVFAADIQSYLDGDPLKGSSRNSFEADPVLARIPIAVLPFRALGEPANTAAFLGSGIMDSLIARLSRVERLSVRPTSAVLSYVHAHDSIRAAKELRVQYVLEGSFHTIGNQVRVSVQLVWAQTATAVWSAHFDEQANDLLKLEDSISEQVAYALLPQLTNKEREQLGNSGTDSKKAHEAYLRGRWHWNRSAGDQEELAKALVCFMEATAEDPEYAKAHVGIADYNLRLGVWGSLPPSESFAAAIEAAATALRLDPALAEAHASFAFATWAYHRDYAKAEQHFQLAIMRNPDYANAHHWFGLLNCARNRPELAIANLDRASKIDPNSQIIAAARGFVRYNARQYRQAVDILTESAREMRDAAPLHEMLSWSHLQLGEMEQALESGRRAVELSGRNAACVCALIHAEAAAGDRATAAQLRGEIESTAEERYVSGYDRASAALAVGDSAKALGHLEQCFLDRDWWICWVSVDPRWDPIRNDPRFKKLILNTQPPRIAEKITVGGTATQEQPRRRMTVPVIIAVAALLIIVAAARWYAGGRPAPFANLKFTKLTTNGKADVAAISPNGKYVAYTSNEPGGMSLWLRETAKFAPVRLTPPLPGMISNLDFTSNGTQVSFDNFPTEQPFNRQVYVVPLSGGPPQQVLGMFSGPVSLSKDGTRAAAVRANAAAERDELWIIDTTTGAERMVAQYVFPERFAWSSPPAWSPDSSLLACAVEGTDSQGFFVHLVTIDTKTGGARPLGSSRWQGVQHMSWLGGTSALGVVGQEIDSSFRQIWYVPYPHGEIRRIGNNLDDYVGVSATASGMQLISVQNQTLSNIFIQRPGISDEVQITPGSSRYFDLAWTPDGRLLYASDATGSADLWTMNPDGTGERQLTSGPGRNYSPASSPDGKTIAFHSNRDGNWNIWRVDASGRQPTALTAGVRGGNWPQFVPRGDFVVYHRADRNGLWNIWKVPVAGGLPVQLTRSMTTHPAVSPKGGDLAAWYGEPINNPQWKLAVFAPEGGEPVRVFDPAVTVIPDSLLRWTPSGDGITFLGYRNDAYNIWVQPIDGRAAHPLTSFEWGEIYSFDWSRDGRLAYSRGMTTNDVVLIRETNGE
jgi:eukaryotic-like serine/threonine-protein kinase